MWGTHAHACPQLEKPNQSGLLGEDGEGEDEDGLFAEFHEADQVAVGRDVEVAVVEVVHGGLEVVRGDVDPGKSAGAIFGARLEEDVIVILAPLEAAEAGANDLFFGRRVEVNDLEMVAVTEIGDTAAGARDDKVALETLDGRDFFARFVDEIKRNEYRRAIEFAAAFDRDGRAVGNVPGNIGEFVLRKEWRGFAGGRREFVHIEKFAGLDDNT